MSDKVTVSDNDEFQKEMMATVLETIMPKIKPLIKPATAKFEKFMNEGSGHTIIAKAIEGKVYFFQINNSDIKGFELEFKEGKEPEGTYELQTFIQKVLSGDFSL